MQSPSHVQSFSPAHAFCILPANLKIALALLKKAYRPTTIFVSQKIHIKKWFATNNLNRAQICFRQKLFLTNETLWRLSKLNSVNLLLTIHSNLVENEGEKKLITIV